MNNERLSTEVIMWKPCPQTNQEIHILYQLQSASLEQAQLRYLQQSWTRQQYILDSLPETIIVIRIRNNKAKGIRSLYLWEMTLTNSHINQNQFWGEQDNFSDILTLKTVSLPDCTGTCKNEYTQGWRNTSAISFRCSRINGGFVIPMRSIVLLSWGSSATMAFNKVGRLIPMSRPTNLRTLLVFNSYTGNKYIAFYTTSSVSVLIEISCTVL